ncbi:MAG TPA: CDP-alcohol phosphatidyltransferase family protein [Terriglobales bacterium]|jgi:cardiolipin synthase
MLQLSQIKSAPNQLTLLRLIFVPFIVTAVIEGHYLRAMILFVLAGVSDGLDGLLARAFNQKTMLGLYLDPIADKLLLSTLFLVLSFKHRIPWRVTTMVFSRDFIILVVCSLVYATTELRDFRPSIWGKLNTVAQIATVFFAMLDEITTLFWVTQIKVTLFWMTFLLTLISSLHYVLLLERRLQEVGGSHKEPSL